MREPEAKSRTVEIWRKPGSGRADGKKTSGSAGFTLIELVVAIAIMSMVIMAAAGLIVSASNSYRISNIEIELQMEAQTAMNQLNDILIEARQYSAVQKPDGTAELTVWTAEKQYIFRLDKENRRLVFRSKEAGDDAPGAEALLAKYCDSFSVTPPARPAKGDAQLVTVSLTFVYADKTYETTSCISLRGEKSGEAEGDIVSLGGKEKKQP